MHDDEVGDNESEGEMEMEGGGDGCHAPQVGCRSKNSSFEVVSIKIGGTGHGKGHSSTYRD